MKPELKKALDKELKKDRIRRSKIWAILVLGVVLVLAIYTPVFSERIIGETIALSVKDRGGISNVQLKVKLESGKEVFVLVDSDVDHTAGQKVEISQMKSLFGMASYQFIQHIEPGS